MTVQRDPDRGGIAPGEDVGAAPGAGQRARAFEYLFDAVVVTDLDGIVVDWNPGAVALYGYARDEIVGQPVSILHAPEDVDRVTAEVFAAIARDGYWTGEIKRRGRDGSIGWIESMVVPLVDGDGAPAGALGINRDITDRKLADARLRASEAQWKALLESLPDGVVVCDQAGDIVMVNARLEALLGYRRDQLVGRSVDLLLPHGRRAAHARQRAGFVASPRSRTMGEGRVLAALHRDGHSVPIEIGLSAIDTPTGSWVIAVLHDVSAREALTERLHLLGAALEAAANGVAISDPQGVCEWINPAFTAITGYAAGDIVGKRLAILNSGTHDAAFFRDLWATITRGDAWHGEITNRHRDGHLYVEEQTIAPVPDATGEIRHYVAIKQDTTQRREMERQLQAANATLTRQLAEIEALQAQLHDQAIRDPLTGLYNRRYLAETLDRELARATRTGDAVAIAIFDADHFKRINDTHGHRAGDEVLRALGAILRAGTRRSDVACRYGGEEFVLLMPGATVEAAVTRVETLRAQVAALAIVHDGRTIRVTLSAGVAAFPTDAGDGDALLHAADAALYAAKDAGRDRVVVHAGVLAPAAATRPRRATPR
ncbi:MAG: PAS domain S-box protein [Kofleriaceae bacterium]|nr:PAS domain S-box protein [Kofleriaceae bacterium]MCB9571840.1 PAS domain S-box protein [Kofleriaceae bacterium]